MDGLSLHVDGVSLQADDASLQMDGISLHACQASLQARNRSLRVHKEDLHLDDAGSPIIRIGSPSHNAAEGKPPARQDKNCVSECSAIKALLANALTANRLIEGGG
jgi:hypothetical protein